MTSSKTSAGPAAGQASPKFELIDADGAKITLAQLKNRPFILYFYPKADTSGCTKEALDFSQLKDNFAALKMPVIAVSADPPAKLAKFRDKHSLTIHLASAEGTTTLEDFGVWVEKSMYGRKYMGIQRATFLIDKEGKIAQIWPKVSVTNHVKDVIKSIEAL